MKKVFFLLALLGAGAGYAQNNLVDTSTWTLGNGSVTGFTKYGADTENIRELGTDPYGNQSILWKAVPDGSADASEGGWYTPYIPIDHTKTYRFTVWVRKSNSTDGSVVFKSYIYDTNSAHVGTNLNGWLSTNPIFEYDDVPQLDKWYLYVGFIHGSGYTGTTGIGGVYDPLTGSMVLSSVDYKFTNTAAYIYQNTSLYGSGNPLDSVYFYDPTIYEVNGQEPTLQELLDGPNSGDTHAPVAPTLASTANTDTTVDLSWSGATDNIGVTGYKIFKDGSLETSLGNVGTYQVTGLEAGTSYSFTTTALDAAGNESAPSSAVSVITDSSSGGGGGSSVWSESGSTASYSGEVAIGASSVPSGYKLAVDGHIRTREIRVDQDTWPDYVFEEGYDLPSLEEIQEFITKNGHLPNVPSAKEVETNGVEVGEMNKLLLEKIEEMMLHIIQLKQESDAQQIEIEKLKTK